MQWIECNSIAAIANFDKASHKYEVWYVIVCDLGSSNMTQTKEMHNKEFERKYAIRFSSPWKMVKYIIWPDKSVAHSSDLICRWIWFHIEFPFIQKHGSRFDDFRYALNVINYSRLCEIHEKWEKYRSILCGKVIRLCAFTA